MINNETQKPSGSLDCREIEAAMQFKALTAEVGIKVSPHTIHELAQALKMPETQEED